MSLADLNAALVAATGVLLLALVGLRLTARTGLPGLLGFLTVGLLVGEAGLGVRFSDFALTQTLGLLALAVIVAEGGLATRWEAVRPTFPLAVVLATLGVGVSVAVVAGAAGVLLDLPIRTALLLGAAVSSTDAAATTVTEGSRLAGLYPSELRLPTGATVRPSCATVRRSRSTSSPRLPRGTASSSSACRARDFGPSNDCASSTSGAGSRGGTARPERIGGV